jgi:hypothetical protein
MELGSFKSKKLKVKNAIKSRLGRGRGGLEQSRLRVLNFFVNEYQ